MSDASPARPKAPAKPRAKKAPAAVAETGSVAAEVKTPAPRKTATKTAAKTAAKPAAKKTKGAPIETPAVLGEAPAEETTAEAIEAAPSNLAESASVASVSAEAPVSREERIRVAAYRRYAARGYTDGHMLDDWVEAEREIEQHAS
jgi:Protein of unknown function (DUF2934)